MKICVNGQSEDVREGLTLAAYLESKGVPQQTVVVEHNGAIPARTVWTALRLAEGDILEIVKFMGGG